MNLLHAKEHDAYHTAENAFMEAIVATGEVEIPEEMINEVINYLRFQTTIQQQGIDSKQMLNRRRS